MPRPNARRDALDETRRQPAGGQLRRRARRLAAGAALALWLAAAPPLAAAAELVTLEASTPGSYSRLLLTFPERQLLPAYTVEIANGVLVVRFEDEVVVDVAEIPVALPGLVTVARADPDGTGIRLALSREVRLSTLEAGERLFIDLLPTDWVGLPPGLPPEVVAELAARAESATRAAREAAIAAGLVTAGAGIEVRVGRAEAFTRIAFGWTVPYEASFTREAGTIAVTFDKEGTPDLTELRVDPPPFVTGATSRVSGGRLTIEIAVDPAADVRAYSDGASYVVDVIGPQAVPGEDPLTALAGALADPAPPPASAADIITAPGTPAAAPVAAVPMVGIPDGFAERIDGVPTPPTRPGPQTAPPFPLAAPEAVAAASAAIVDPAAPVRVVAEQVGGVTQLVFPFAAPTAAAMFQRDGALWLVFDSEAPIDTASLVAALGPLARGVTTIPLPGGTAFRADLTEPRLAAAQPDGARWIVSIGDTVLSPTQPLTLERAAGAGGDALRVSFGEVGSVRTLTDPVIGDRILVATGQGPARGLVASQRFMEVEALSSVHGVAAVAAADDVVMRAAAPFVEIGRAGGALAMSFGLGAAATPAGFRTAGEDVHVAAAGDDHASVAPHAEDDAADHAENAGHVAAAPAAEHGTAPGTNHAEAEVPPAPAQLPTGNAPASADIANFWQRHDALAAAAESLDAATRSAARFALARHFIANLMPQEASGQLDIAAAEFPTDAVKPAFRLMRAAAAALSGHYADALAALDTPALVASADAAVWRTLAAAGLGDAAAADAAFRAAEPVLAAYPTAVATRARLDGVAAALDLGDAATAATRLAALPRLLPGTPAAAEFDFLDGRIAAAAGRTEDARALFASAAARGAGAVAADAALHLALLEHETGAIGAGAALDRLEALAVGWRGDAVELRTLAAIAELSVARGDHRRAFEVLAAAQLVAPEAAETRALEASVQEAFAALFLDGGADALPVVEALSLYYDFRALTPVSSRGDAMVRALAGRLVAADLLRQAEELLAYQIDNRVTGAARAQVAADLAAVYLLDGDPEAALLTLNRSRLAQLPEEIERQRRLIEARALAEAGDPALGVEVLAPLSGTEVDRLRAEILWRGALWQPAGEAYERLIAGRWSDARPLTEDEQLDAIRAGIAYVFAGDGIGLDRLRVAFSAKMSETPNAATFAAITADTEATSPDVLAAAAEIAALDLGESFLAEYRTRYLSPAPVSPAPAA